jgi:hypothetical protein
LKEQAHAHAIELHVLDARGFAPTLPGGYTWAREGVRAIVPSEAPEGRRVNVIGSWVPFGDRPRRVYRIRTTSFKGPDVLEFLWPDRGGLSTPVGVVPAGYQRERPCVVVLDNDSVHKSQEIKAHVATLEAVGIHLFYLLLYSPELNLIEGLWRPRKHEELPSRSSTTVETLRQAVEAALAKRASALSVAEAACQVAPRQCTTWLHPNHGRKGLCNDRARLDNTQRSLYPYCGWKRADWEISGPPVAGWELYPITGSPVDPNRLAAAPSGGWFGPRIQCSAGGGLTN